MNVISYSHAYSLYPEATFQKSLSLICYQCDGVKRTLPIQKYMTRGWKMVNYDGIEYIPSTTDVMQPVEVLPGNHSKIFHQEQMRHLGDSHCWTYKLPDIPVTFHPGPVLPSSPVTGLLEKYGNFTTPLAREVIQAGFCPVESNSWTLGRGNDTFGDITFTLLDTLRSLIIHYLSEVERVKGQGVDRDELIDWYLESKEDEMQDLDELEYEKKLITNVLRRLVKVSIPSFLSVPTNVE